MSDKKVRKKSSGPNKNMRAKNSNKDKNKIDKKMFNRNIKRILSMMGPDKYKLIVVFIFAILSTLFLIVGPKIMGNATTEIFNGIIAKIRNPQEGINFAKIFKIVYILAIMYALSSVFTYLQAYIMSGISQRISYNLRKEISEKFNKLPISYFDKNQRGDIISRVTNDVDTLSQTLNQSLMQAITSVITVIGVLIMMISINLVMSLVALTLLPLTMILLGFVIKKSQKYFNRQQDYLGKINSKIEESFSGQNVIRANNGEKYEISEFEKINNKLYNTGWKSQFFSSIMMPIMMFVGNLGYVVVAILGGYLTMQGKIAVGDIQAFVQYMRSFTQPLNQLAQMLNLLQSTVAASERIFSFLDEEEIDVADKKVLAEEEFDGHLEFKHVNFGYDKDKIIINDFNLDVKTGQKIAIVGPTGAGKTTLVKLLMRFYKPNSGKILLDGLDIDNIDYESYRNIFAMVLQDTWLFTGTIMENLRYGKLDASDEEVFKAARLAYADRFIMTQPNGYNTELNQDSRNISQGQKQLLTIARAILSDPKILILDEATSSVDTRTEELIQKAMDNLIKDRTSFIIAHRLSTIKNADTILVMDNGDIIEQGSHEELLNKDGFYKKLYDSQYEEIEEVN
ncbi:ABC transporter ATP-binding protein [Peptostreptococcus equinus]|uniref:ABC transporter ATP-binding protein n=1 Tax=Peptostreptococcus equinus TaxID=3003601 RepID=A0ABY7JQN7_9FIRM|nr:ABC transporter ATP-binding protein [Peptostreptococcus sp. CBA3647]WAW15669.1 ABC transporter ATP-binding protein [Peptostreptococcus sp. CBA3647]